MKRCLALTCCVAALSTTVALFGCDPVGSNNPEDSTADDGTAVVDDASDIAAPDTTYLDSVTYASFTVRWNAVAEADSYLVILQDYANEAIDSFTTTDTVYHVSDPAVDGECWVGVHTCQDGFISEDHSAYAMACLLVPEPPMDVELLRMTPDSALIGFSPSPDASAPSFVGYRLYFYDSKGTLLDSMEIDSSAQSATLTGLEADAAYRVSVVSVGAYGPSAIDTNCRYDTASTHFNSVQYPYLLIDTYGPPPSLADTTVVAVEGGIYRMGYVWSRDSGSILPTGPVHEVIVSPFYMGKYEVTRAEYCEFLNAHADDFTYEGDFLLRNSDSLMDTSFADLVYSEGQYAPKAGEEQVPVGGLLWYGAAAYCNWLSAQHGLDSCYDSDWNCDFTSNGYRLPTEAEFEYVQSRAYTGRKQRFPWGFEWDTSKLPRNNTGPVAIGSYKAYDGMYDITGNTMEFVNDWSDESSENTDTSSYYGQCLAQGVVTDPRGPNTQVEDYRHLMRGGSAGTGIKENMCTYRYLNHCMTIPNSGFRVARSAN